MNIEIKYLKSNTEKIIYIFEIYNNFNIVYKGIMYSARNDENDVWGDEWDTHFSTQKEKELREFELANDYYPDSWGYDSLDDEYKKISDKYNPVLHKTKDGHRYYHGSYGGKLPKFEITPAKMKKLIKDKLIKGMKTAKFFA